jgi:hypothetical protein
MGAAAFVYVASFRYEARGFACEMSIKLIHRRFEASVGPHPPLPAADPSGHVSVVLFIGTVVGSL